ncbi:MAG: hypothetical protein H6577_10775 [Lewinellaceae bacterium]|nr:hypothetical protein [Saprospiraceae bacterium]MCB9338596.1 hypothetical protein [Lewinellaceae bacterium]
MITRILLAAGSLIFLILGGMHLAFTFFSDKFSPKNPQLEKSMKASSPLITRRTTMWNAWVGFNASHSLGAIFFGAVNLLLVWQFYSVFEKSWSILLLDLPTILFYWFLGKKYWFNVPFAGITIAGVLFLVAAFLLHFT